MTRNKTHWLRNSVIILLLFAIAGFAMTCVKFKRNPGPTVATAGIEFTFEDAPDGIAPNGTPFDISDIVSDEVLSGALQSCGLEGTYSVDQLRQCLVARGVYPANMVSRVKSYISLLDASSSHIARINDFHATTYNIELYNSFDSAIPKEQLLSLMKAIVSAYKDYFARVYANGLRRDDLTAALSGYDYLQQADVVEAYFASMADYAREMYVRRPAFRYEGAAFSDISVRLESLVDGEISRLRANLTLDALSRDPERLKAHYAFEIDEMENRQKSLQVMLEQLDKLIERYEKNSTVYVSSGANMTRIDSNTNETYDTLIRLHTSVAEKLTAITARCAIYRQRMEDMKAGDQAFFDEMLAEPAAQAGLTEAQASVVAQSISAIVDKGNACIDDFEAMLKRVNEEEINDATVAVTGFGARSPKLFSSDFNDLAIRTVAPFCAIGFMLCMVLIIISRVREAKRSH